MKILIVHSKMFPRIVFSRIKLQDMFAMLKLKATCWALFALLTTVLTEKIPNKNLFVRAGRPSAVMDILT